MSFGAVPGSAARADDDARAARRDHRHVAVQGALGRRVLDFEVEPPRRRLEDDALLGHRQRRAQAAADAAAEGDPLVGPRLAVEPALGLELERFRVEVLAVVQEQDADQDRRVRPAPRSRPGARAASPGGRRSAPPAASASSRRSSPRSSSRRPRRSPSAPSRAAARGRPGCAAGAPSVQASELAVVSCPARTRVSSSSRISSSVSSSPSSVFASSSSERMSRRSSRSAERRRGCDHRVHPAVDQRAAEAGEADRLVAAHVHQLGDLGDRLGRDVDEALDHRPQPLLGRARRRARPRCRRSRP